MLHAAWLMAKKDLYTLRNKGGAVAQAVLLGLLLVFLFSLAGERSESIAPMHAATVFWIASAFCQTLIFSSLYALEEANAQRLGLLLVPAPCQFIWLGKALAGFLLLLLLQSVFALALVVFLGQTLTGDIFPALAALLLVDTGLAVAGSLLAALAQGQSTRESLCSIIVFPLLIPLFLAGIHCLAATLSQAETGTDTLSWLGLAAAFDAIFTAAALVLFPFIYRRG